MNRARPDRFAENSVAAIFSANPLLLAPMSGVTEAPFRAICKRMGAGLTYTEMVSAKGLHYNPDARGAVELLTIDAGEIPCGVQLFGADPEMMAQQAARIASERAGEVGLIDINMGCPVSKVVAKGEGSALMRDPARAAEVVSAVVSAVDVPVTVKFRSGWDASTVNAADFARAMEAAGASALAVHGRTREQFYHGRADWGVIAAVKQAVSVPVAGSGDVFTPADAVRMIEQTGVDAVMVARGARGNPWIFSRFRGLRESGTEPPPPTHCERIEMAREHAAALRGYAGERSFVRMRKHVAWYVAEMPGAAAVRVRVNECRAYEELDALLAEYRHYLEGR